MKLAFCLYKYFPFGGLQRDFLRIAQECIRRGHQVHVYTMHWEGANDAQLPVTIIPTKGLQNCTRSKNFVKQLRAHLNQQQHDLVIGFNKMPELDVYYAADVCFQARAHKKHGRWYRMTPNYCHWVNFEKAVFAQDKKTEILLISKFQQQEFTQYYQTPETRFHLLPPGIAKDRVAPTNAAETRASLRQEMNIADDEFLLLMVGSGFKTKGLDRTLLGIANLPKELIQRAHLFIIGDDNAISFLKLATKLNIAERVKFLGGRNDVPRFLLGADLLLHPAYHENTGTVLLEALASGLPVLTTDICGYAHYILEANAGMVVPSPFQQTQFNKMLKDMLLSLHQTSWRENALAFAQQADIYSLPEQAVNFIESLGQ